MTDIEYLDIPDKSDNDEKKYRCFRLSNGLMALVISTEGSIEKKRSACSLMVKVGAFTEPKEYHGLAHLLEHMIYMGSEKFPEENAFDKHLIQSGGFSNAFTAFEATTYYLSIIDQHLEEALEIFSDSVKAPLLRKETMTRERNAVESEFQMKKSNDEARRIQLLSSLANPQYPHYNVFIYGNLKTLKGNSSDDDELHKQLKDFYKQFYTADRMIVCIQSQLPLDKLEQFVLKYFSEIPSTPMKPVQENSVKLYPYQDAFPDEKFSTKVYFVKAEQDQRKIQLTWCLPQLRQFYRCQPDNFVCELLTRDCEGSLCSYLMRKLWAVALFTTYNPFEKSSFFTLISLHINVTDEGFANLEKVTQILAATFAYIKLLSKCETLKENYDEYQHLRMIDFRFKPESTEVENVNELAECITLFPIKDIITGNYLYSEFNENQINTVIRHLNEFKFNVMITSKMLHPRITDIGFNLNEPLFGTDYAAIAMPDEWQKLWEKSEPIDELFIALPKNNFRPMDFEILWTKNGKPEQSRIVQKIFDTDMGQLWFRQDDKFLVPKCYMQFYFISPLLQENAKNNILAILLCDLITFHATEELYWAAKSGIECKVYTKLKGIVLEVNGYNDKINLVVSRIVQLFITIGDFVTDVVLDVHKKELIKTTYNDLVRHDRLYRFIFAALINKNCISVVDRHKVVPQITLNDFREFSKRFTEQLYVRALIQGNLEESSAVNVMTSILNSFKCPKITEAQRMLIESQISKIPIGMHSMRIKNLTESDVNSIVSNYYQMGRLSLRETVILKLMLALIKEPLFDTLRTKEQLAYDVGVNETRNFGVSGYVITVRSQEDKFEAMYVEKRIEAFRRQAFELIEKMPESQFEHSRQSLVSTFRIYPNTLKKEFIENFTQIAMEEFDFDIRTNSIEILKMINKSHVLEFWRNHDGENLRKFSIQIVGNSSAQAAAKAKDESERKETDIDIEYLPSEDPTTISNIDTFKNEIEYFPLDKNRTFFS